jgi:hypothetical protein
VLFFITAAASFNGFYDKWGFIDPGRFPQKAARFDVMANGTVKKPFAYRRLLLDSAGWIERMTPQRIKTGYLAEIPGTDRTRLEMALDLPRIDPAYEFRYVVIYLADFGFAFLSLCAMYLLCRQLGTPVLGSLLVPVSFTILFPYLESSGGFFYDYPEVAFMALAAWIALRFTWWWLLPIVALGTWNKESFLLFVVTLYPLMRSRARRMHAAIGTAALCAASAAVYFVIRMRFAHNAGGTVEFHLGHQLHYFAEVSNWLFPREKTYGLLMFKPMSLVPMALLAWTIRRGWRGIPKAFRQHAAIAALLSVPLFVLFCSPGEIRNFSMLYMTFVALGSSIVSQWSWRYDPLNPIQEEPAAIPAIVSEESAMEEPVVV